MRKKNMSFIIITTILTLTVMSQDSYSSTIMSSASVSSNHIAITQSEETITSEASSNSSIILPATYDGRDLGYVTPLKKQKDNYCWAMSAVAAMESNLLRKNYKNIDLSEKKLIALRHGKMYDPLGNSSCVYKLVSNISENTELTMLSGITNGIGLVDESATDAYSMLYFPEATAYDRSYVPKSVEITAYAKDNMDTIKENIIKYGGGTLKIPISSQKIITHAGKDNLPEANIYVTGISSISHLVELIGWDDNYPKENFTPVCASDGAWLAKDPNGYFAWIPYCDVNNEEFRNRSVMFYDMAENFYDNNYHYGNGGENVIIKSASNPGTVSYLTVFTSKAKTTEKIKAIVTGLDDSSGSVGECIITLFKNPVMVDGIITSYDNAKAYLYKPAFLGIHTITFPEGFTVSGGDVFAVQLDVPYTTGVYHEIYEDIGNKGFEYCFDGSRRQNYFKAAEDSRFKNYSEYPSREKNILGVKVLTDGAINQMEYPAPIETYKVFSESPYDIVTIDSTEKAPSNDDSAENDIFTENNITYKIKKEFVLNENGDVVPSYYAAVIYGKEYNKSKLTIKARVKHGQVEYKVKEISKGAFAGNKKIRQLVIGNNVEQISKNAFKGCRKLKTIRISSGNLKRIHTTAFKKTAKSLTIKCPKKCKKKYQKMFK